MFLLQHIPVAVQILTVVAASRDNNMMKPPDRSSRPVFKGTICSVWPEFIYYF